jgi:hypothetical protein
VICTAIRIQAALYGPIGPPSPSHFGYEGWGFTIGGRFEPEIFRKAARFRLQTIRLDSTPGIPLKDWGVTNKTICENPELADALVDLTTERAARLLSLGEEVDGLSAWELSVQHRLADPIRVFIKSEPMKRSKIENERYRLIWSISLIDQLLERVLWYEQTKEEISAWETIPSKPGMGLHDDGLNKLARSIVNLAVLNARHTGSMELVDRDVKGSDMQVPSWALLAAHASAWAQYWWLGSDSDWFRIHLARHRVAVRPLACTSDGQAHCLDRDGLVLSGRFVTSFINSRLYTALSLLRGEMAMAMGDDTIETNTTKMSTADIVGFYGALGFPTEVSTHDLSREAEVEFCSMKFRFSPSVGGIGFRGAVPSRWVRTVIRLLCNSGTRPHDSDEHRLICPTAEVSQLRWVFRSMPEDFHKRLDALVGPEGPPGADA